MISTVLLPIIIMQLLLLEDIARFSMPSIDEIKLDFIVSCIFHLSDF